MKINDENLNEMRDQFIPMFKMFRKKLAEEDIPETEKNAILYNVIIELVDKAFLENFEGTGMTAEEHADLKKSMLNAIIEIWKEQDPELVIDDEVISYSEQISQFGKDNI